MAEFNGRWRNVRILRGADRANKPRIAQHNQNHGDRCWRLRMVGRTKRGDIRRCLHYGAGATSLDGRIAIGVGHIDFGGSSTIGRHCAGRSAPRHRLSPVQAFNSSVLLSLSPPGTFALASQPRDARGCGQASPSRPLFSGVDTSADVSSIPVIRN